MGNDSQKTENRNIRTSWRNEDKDANRQIGTRGSVNWTGVMKQIMKKEKTALREADKERSQREERRWSGSRPGNACHPQRHPSRSAMNECRLKQSYNHSPILLFNIPFYSDRSGGIKKDSCWWLCAGTN